MFDKKVSGGKNSSRNGLARHRPKLKELLLASATAGVLALAAQEARADLTWYTLDNTTSSVQTVGLNAGNLANYRLADPSALESGSVQYPWAGVTFTATESGNFYFGQTYSPTDTVMIFYNGVFDPTRPGYGAIVGNDDTPQADHQALVGSVPVICGTTNAYCPQIKADIVAGHTYTLFISVFNPVTGVALPLTFYSTASVAFGPYTGRNPIDLGASFYLSSQLGITVDPDFVGGTLKMDEEGHTYSQGFTVAHIDSSTIEMNGTNSVFTGAFSDAATSPQGNITFKDSVGGGSVTFSGANTYTGTTTLASGLVKAGAADVFATSSQVTVMSGARFDMSGASQTVKRLAGGGTIALGSRTLTANGSVDYSGLITGSGNLVINAGGRLSGASDYSGGTTVRNGTLQAYNSAALGTGIVTVVTPAILELNSTNGNLSVGNVINGDGVLNIRGAGTTTLTASNTSIGTLDVGGGGLVLAQNGAFKANAGSVASGSTLKINDTAQLNTTGQYQQASTATLTVEMNGRSAAAITADTAILGGTLNVTGLSTSGTVARASDLTNGSMTVVHTARGITGDFSSVNLGGAGSSVDYLALSAGKSTDGNDYNVGFGLSWLAGPQKSHGTFTIADGASFDVDVALTNQAASAIGWNGKTLTKKGAGTLILSAQNTYTGNTYILDGTLKAGIANAFSSSEQVFVADGTRLALAGFDQTVKKLWGAGAIDLGSATLTIYVPSEFDVQIPDDPEYYFSGVISGAGRLVKTGDGDFILSGINTYSGGTTIREGTLMVTNGKALGTGDVAMDFLSRLLLDFRGDITLANKLEGAGDLQKFGLGTAILTAAGSSAGLVSAEKGTLVFAQNGVFTADDYFTASGATTTINGSARLSVNNGIMQVENSTLNVEFGGRTEAAITAQTASLDGTLNVTGFSGSSTAAKASELVSDGVALIHTTGGISGDFSSVTIGGAANSIDYLTLSASKSADNKDYNVGFGLSWFAGPENGHGTFTLAEGASFDVDVLLDDQAASATGWEGRKLTKAGAGTLILSHANSYGGGTTISGGKVVATGGSSLGAGAVAVASGAALQLDFAGDWTLANVVSGSGSLQKTGAGTASLVGAASSVGSVDVAGGVLNLAQNGAFTAGNYTTRSNATTEIDGTARLAVTGAFTQENNATLDVVLPTSGDAPVSADTATLAGILNITGFSGSGTSAAKASDLASGQKTVIHTARGITGDFSSVNLGGASSPVDYLTVSAGKSADNKDYNVGFGLSWFASEDKAHGTFTVASGSSFDVDVALSDRSGTFVGWGGNTLTKEGAGTLILSAQNSYTGPTYIKAGTVKMGVVDAFASSNFVSLSAGTTLDLNDFNQRTHDISGAGDIKLGSATLTMDVPSIMGMPLAELSGTISGTGGLVKEGEGSLLVLSGVNSYRGGTTIADGALVLWNGKAAGTGDIVGSGELILGFDAASTLANKLQGVDLTIDRSANATLTAANSSVGIIDNYRGTLTLAMDGALTARRATNDMGATLTIGANSSLHLKDDFRNVSDATLNVAVGALTDPAITANTASLAGILNITGFSGNGASAAKASDLASVQKTVIHTSNGITGDFSSVTLGGASSPVDYLTVSAGKSADNKDYNVGFGLSWFAGPEKSHGTFTVADGASFDVDVVLSNQTTTSTNGWDGTTLIKAGAGTLTLSAVNSYGWVTDIRQGVLKTGVTNAVASSAGIYIRADAEFDLNGYDQQVNILFGEGATKLGSNDLTIKIDRSRLPLAIPFPSIGPFPIDYSGQITGTGSVTIENDAKGVIYTLTGNSDYSGGTTILAGMVAATNGKALGTGAVAVNDGASLEFGFAGDETFANTLSGGGGLQKTGAGTARLTGTASSIGSVDVAAGVVNFAQNGAFTAGSYTTRSNATTEIGGASRLAVTGAFTQEDGSTLNVVLPAGGDAPVSADTATLAGILNITGFSGNGASAAKASDLASGRKTVIHTAHGITGDFSSVNLGGASSPVDYLTVSAGKSADGNDYNVGFGLSWFAGPEKSHGRFTVADGASFDVDVDLSDQPVAYANGWDGHVLTKDGLGKLVLSAANTYTGVTDLRAGTLQTGIANAFVNSASFSLASGTTFDLNGFDQRVNDLSGSGNVTLGSGNLTVVSRNDLAFLGVMSGTGSLTKTGTGSLTLSGANTYSGGTAIAAGTMIAQNGRALGTGTVANDAALILDFASDSTFANTLSGTGSLTKTGAGTATLTGAGSNEGAVSVDAGTLRFAQTDAFTAASLTTAADATTALNANATLALSGALTQAAGSTLSVTVGTAQPVITAITASLDGTLNVTGYAGTAPARASELTSTQFQVIHTTGGITGDFASVNLGGAGSTVEYLTLSGGKSTDGKDYNVGFGLSWYADPAQAHGTFNLASGDNFDVDVALNDRSYPVTAGMWDGMTLSKWGSGTLTLSAANGYTGGTVIREGVVKAGISNAVASSGYMSISAGAVFDLNGYDQQVTVIVGEGTTSLGSNNLDMKLDYSPLFVAPPPGGAGTPTVFYSGRITGTGAVTIENDWRGIYTLTGNSDYSGGTKILAGKVAATNGNALGTGAVAVNSGASLEFGFAGDETFANTLSGGGSLQKTGAGTAKLTGAASSIGSIDVAEGMLHLAQNGQLTSGSYRTESGATTRVSGAARLNVTGAFTQDAGSTLNVALDPATVPAITAGSASIAGNLQVSGFAGVTAAKASHLLAGRTGVIHTTGGIAGDFDSVSFGLRGALGSDYVTLAGWKSDDGKDYSVGFGLTWQAAANRAHGMFNLADAADTFEIDVPLGDRAETLASGWDGKGLMKMGDGTLILSAANTFTGGAALLGGTVRVSSDANLGAANGRLIFDGGTLETTASFASERSLTLAGTGTLKTAEGTELALKGAIDGAGGLTKKGSGTLALDGNASYLGSTLIDEGRVEARRANVLSASSSHMVGAGAALVLDGYDQTVANLANAGEVRIGALDGSRAGATLTVTGAYVSNGGSLFLNTVLGSDNSATDRLVTGSVEMAGAATKVFIANAGGFGDYTNANGIEIVQVGDASQSAAGAFVLGGRVAAGAYDYHLFQGGVGTDANDGNWYLRNQRPEEPALPDIRPEVPLVMAVPPLAIEYGYTLLDTRHQRFAETAAQPAQPAYEERVVRCKDARQKYRCVIRTPIAPSAASTASYGTWGRIFGTKGSQEKHNFMRNGPDYDYTFGGGQVGFDVYARDHSDGHLDRAGIYVSYGQISSKVKGVYGGKAGTVDMDAYSVAGYWTHQAPEGWYSDAVVQGTWYSADAKSVLGQQMKPDGFGIAISAEGGYAFKMGGGFSLEPQAQLVYQVVSFDDVRDRYGFASFDKGDSLRGRVGARLTKSWDAGEADKPRLITGWVRANLWHEFLGDGKTLVTDLNGANPTSFGSPLRGTWVEIGAGVSGQVSDSTTLFLNGAYNRSVDNKGREAWDGRLGVNVKW